MKRRGSVGPDGRPEAPITVKTSLKEMKQQLRLGPANRAAHPLNNTREVFKIKQGLPPQPIRVNSLNPDGIGFGSGMPSTQQIVAVLHEDRDDPAALSDAASEPVRASESILDLAPEPTVADEDTPLLNPDANGAATVRPYGANGNSKSKKNKKNKKK